jgi:hypothetical protein
MAKIVDVREVVSTWDVPGDVDDIVKCIGGSADAKPNRLVLFVGETHTARFDKLRNAMVVNRLKGGGKAPVLVVERAMFDDKEMAKFSNVIVEADRTSSPAARERNSGIVVQLVEFIKSQESEPLSPVVFVFGQTHEPHIKAEIERRFPDDETIQWWSFPSIDDQLDRLAALYDPSALPGQFTLIGYVSSVDITKRRQELEMSLLQKGYLPKRFNVKLYSPPLLPRCIPTAIYSNNAQFAAACNNDLEIHGAKEVALDDAASTRCKQVAYDDVAEV